MAVLRGAIGVLADGALADAGAPTLGCMVIGLL